MTNFSLCHNVSKSHLLQIRQDASASAGGKGLYTLNIMYILKSVIFQVTELYLQEEALQPTGTHP